MDVKTQVGSYGGQYSYVTVTALYVPRLNKYLFQFENKITFHY